jgi:ferrous iron transport protein A
MLLTELKVGEKGEIVECICNDISAKLMEMGLIPGEILEMHEPSPLGDPIRVKVMGSELSLRIEEANNVIVKKI